MTFTEGIKGNLTGIEVTLIETRGVLPFDSKDDELVAMTIKMCANHLNCMNQQSKNGVTLYDAEKMFNIEPFRHHIFFGWEHGDEIRVAYHLNEKKIMITFKCRML